MTDSGNRVPVGSQWQHRNGDRYFVVANAEIEADLTPCVVYREYSGTRTWVRPTREFLDGRFTQLD